MTQATRRKCMVKVAVSATHIEEVTFDGAPVGNQEDAELEQLLDENAAEREALQNQVPDGAVWNEHDTVVVSKIRVAAIKAMSQRGITVTAKQSKDAIQLIPRVCGLARKIHDSSPVSSAFAKVVEKDTTIVGQT
ncbi:hypothetical protein B0H17DRAFT_1338308 [Mycena rosella]|uniref:Uncharacterized protein n=1 Tax=Mycena rosella TaxID=1033263 RepID=A0AAD7CN66_MYCRO|nr:hypothetical protein B0H17DRAFT_1338308 [Mycena rosella]